jgi:DNA-binding Xre family transcriptional regulator
LTTAFRLREVIEGQDSPPSLKQLERAAGVSYNTIFAMYHNRTKGVELATLDALAKALDCEPGELIGRPGAKSGRRGGARG